MSLALTNKLEILQDRSLMLSKARRFFSERKIAEVDVPILSRNASVDLHIDLISASCLGQPFFLHSSPEYGMKRLLAEGMQDIYQLTHVFREGEKGNLHNPEFLMAEWYRVGFTLEEMIAETLAFCQLFVDFKEPFELLSYEETFLRYIGKYPDSQEQQSALFAFEIEPHLGRAQPTVIFDFPPEQAALSQIGENGLAERFEVYLGGLEIGNGYHELLDSKEQKKRQEKANLLRKLHNKQTYPIDHNLISALEKPIPDCCGVAVGFDRLMMLRHNAQSIDEVLAFAWESF